MPQEPLQSTPGAVEEAALAPRTEHIVLHVWILVAVLTLLWTLLT